MKNSKLNSKNTETPILSLIQEIKDGKVVPSGLNKKSRQQCVEVFMLEGYTLPSIAQILNRSERTIMRDIDEVRERNSLSPDPELAKGIIGEFLTSSRNHIGYLMRLARSKEASIEERTKAEYCAAQVESNLITKLQSLGYLPYQPQVLAGDKLLVDQSTHYHMTNVLQQLRRLEVKDEKAIS